MRAVLAVLAGVLLWGALWTAGAAALSAAMPGSFDAEGFTLQEIMVTSELPPRVTLILEPEPEPAFE